MLRHPLLRRGRPKVIIVQLPCRAFSIIQALNKKRLKKTGAWDKIWCQGVQLLNFACEVCRWQHEQGRTFVLEHPWNARSWKKHNRLINIMGLVGVER